MLCIARSKSISPRRGEVDCAADTPIQSKIILALGCGPMSAQPKRYFQAWLIDLRFQGTMLTSHFKGVMTVFAEVALHHSITSSARNRSDGGTEMPSALAILTLIAISNFTGTLTGK